MLTAQRKAFLLDKLSQEGRLVAASLASALGLSEDTIRRDLRELASEGRLLRVHGGALPVSPTHRPLQERRGMEAVAKAALAQAGAARIRPGQVVILDGGSTHLALASALDPSLSATIVTHAPGIAAALEPFPRIEVVLLGGRLMRHSMVALGPETSEAYLRLKADLCFLGVTGLHPETGLTTGDAEEAALKRLLLRAAGEVVVLATPDKIGASSPWSIAPLTAAHALISPGPRPDWLPPGVSYQGL